MDKKLVGLIDYLDTGRQTYNEAIACFYNTEQLEVPLINGLLKMLYNPVGKTKILGLVEQEWKEFAYQDPVPTDIFYYDKDRNVLIMERPLFGTNATFSGKLKTKEFEAEVAEVDTLTVGNLNVINNINKVIKEILTVEDNMILLNANVIGDPDDNSKPRHAGIAINRGDYSDAFLLWDEYYNRWILNIPKDSRVADKSDARDTTVELFGTNDVDRRINIYNAEGFYFDVNSTNRNAGMYNINNGFTSGIYWDKSVNKYVAEDKNSKFILVGMDLLEPGRRVKLGGSAGIEVYNNSDIYTALDFIHTDSNGTEDTRGSIVYDHDNDKMVVSTKEDTFELINIKTWNPFGDSWYYTTTMNSGYRELWLPTSKTIHNVDPSLLQVFINGVHCSPDLYEVVSTNCIRFNETLKSQSTITVYHNVFMTSNYRLPVKTIPNYITGVTGNKVYASHSGVAIIGEAQSLVLKNGVLLTQDIDFTVDRITETTLEITFTVALKASDKVTVYPFLTPNIFVKGDNALVFKSNLAHPTDIEGSAHILFKRGDLPTAGLRWNEATDNLEVNNATGIWEPLVGSSTKFDMERYVISSASNNLSILDMIVRNDFQITDDFFITVFKNGFQMDNPNDYTRSNSDLVFTNKLSVGDIIYVYVGKAFIKSHNYLTSLKDVQVAETDITDGIITFRDGFVYEPGSDCLNIFVNGILARKDIDYIELDEKSVRFNYMIKNGAVIQAFAPTIVDSMRYSKKTFEFNITDVDDYLNSTKSNCNIIVNRGTSSPAVIRWDEVNDNWYLSNGDGQFRKILTSLAEEKKYTQFHEYSNISGQDIVMPDFIGDPDLTLVYINGNLQNTSKYTIDADTKTLHLVNPITTVDRVSVLSYTTCEIQFIDRYIDSYTQKYMKTGYNINSLDIALDKKVKGIPVVSVFVDGILQASNTYSVSLADDGRTAKIAFNGTRSGRIDVILGLNSNVQTYLNGENENVFIFNTHTSDSDYDDFSVLGNWYIRSSRGNTLYPDYIKWDELQNEFVFSTGSKKEYKFAKVVFADEFFTPNENEEVLLVHKTLKKQFAFFDGSWYDLVTGEKAN